MVRLILKEREGERQEALSYCQHLAIWAHEILELCDAADSGNTFSPTCMLFFCAKETSNLT